MMTFSHDEFMRLAAENAALRMALREYSLHLKVKGQTLISTGAVIQKLDRIIALSPDAKGWVSPEVREQVEDTLRAVQRDLTLSPATPDRIKNKVGAALDALRKEGG